MSWDFRAVLASASLAGMLLVESTSFAKCVLDTMASFPVTLMDQRVVVPGTVNGKPIDFVIDSGAFFSMIQPSSAAALGLALVQAPRGLIGQGLNGKFDFSLATVEHLGIANIALSNIDFLVGGSDIGLAQSGIIGQNILHLGDVDYDLAKGIVKLMKPHDCAETNLAYWDTSGTYSVITIHGMDEANRLAIGQASVNGVAMRVLFDTGAPQSSLSLSAARRAGIDQSTQGVVAGGYSGGLGSRLQQVWIAPVQSFRIGEEEVHHTHLRVMDRSTDEYDLLLGLDFFLSHHVYVSNKQHKLYFTYNGGAVFDTTRRPTAAAVDAVAGSSDPTDADGFARRGAALAARRNFTAAIADLTKAITMAPAEPKYLYARASAYADSGQKQKALADLDQALTLRPDDVTGLTQRAALRLAAHAHTEAIADLDRASKAASEVSPARLEIAFLYGQADAFTSSIDQYDAWISTHPDDDRMGLALNGRCWVRAVAGRDLDHALQDCNKALRRLDHAPGVLTNRGLVFLRKGDFDKSIADSDAALARNPKLATALYIRGVAELGKGMTAAGNADIAAGTTLKPELPDWARNHGIVAR